MSDPSHSHDEEHHEGPIKTTKQLVVTVLLSFIVPVIVIVMLASYVTDENRPAAGSDALTPESIALRIAPVGAVTVKDVTNPASWKTGEQVYAAQCGACHTGGLAGAPKLGDAAAWSPRITQGYDVLLTSALQGKNAMSAQGGGDFSDMEIGRAVAYMANQGGANFAEPGASVDAAAAPTADTVSAPAAESLAAAPAPVEATPAEPVVVAAPVAAPVAAVAPVVATGVAAAVKVTPAKVTPAKVMPATVTPAALTPAKAAPAAAPLALAAVAAAPPALYGQMCAVCHGAGIAGAPKVGDKAAWAPRLAQGIDGLTASAIKGKGAMPPRGGSQSSDADIKAVVTYMVNASK